MTLLEARFVEEEASEMAYSIAASQAFKEATRAAAPILMEPFMSLEVTTPSEFTGEVIADINSKRGKILSLESKQNKEVIKAEVPLATMFGYSTDLRSKSQGRANFSLQFNRYIEMPPALAKATLEKKGIFI